MNIKSEYEQSELEIPQTYSLQNGNSPPNAVSPPQKEQLEAKPGAIGEHFDLSSPEYYLNRELTWLEFNRRVLHEGQDLRTPLLERVMFLAVVGSNIDEFFMKRIGGLKQQVGAQLKALTVDGRTPQQQITECCEVVADILGQQQNLERDLLAELRKHDIKVATFGELNAEQMAWVNDLFRQKIYPLLTPQGMDPAHPFPFLSNMSLNLLVATKLPKEDGTHLNRTKIPIGSGLPRFIRVMEGNTFIPYEEIIANNLGMIFPEMEILSSDLFRVTRNAITEQSSEQANDLLVVIESALRDRKFAEIVRLEVSNDIDLVHKGMLAAELEINEQEDVVTVEGLFVKRDLMQIATLDIPELHYPTHQPVDHYKLSGDVPNIFHLIRKQGPLLLQHPYESFSSSVERFLKDASTDPKVLAIKMTLYRTSSDSRIIQYLLDAVNNGKQVAVVVELKARFDELANIRWANSLEQAGIHVTYGVVGLKTHSKVIFVIRQDYNGLRRYAHIGTGNYHAGTARIYSDLGLLTCDPDIGHDLTELFNFLTMGYAPARNYTKLLPSPRILKKRLLALIQRETDHQMAGRVSLIQFKTNALEDKDVVEALYRASRSGVHIDLIIRDSCRIRPGIPGLSDTIRVISIVGRFLEHSRIYYFRNNGNDEYYIGSADIMKRNLEDRVEVITPVDAPTLQTQLRNILDAQLADFRSAWEMQTDGTYTQRIPLGKEDQRSCHEILIEKARKRLSGARLSMKSTSKGHGRRKAS